MSGREPEYTLEFLLAFDGRVHHLEKGYWIKFEIKRVEPTGQRPHGLSYSFTLHAPNGVRVVGFDNAHGVSARGSRFRRPPEASDHWHRNDPARFQPRGYRGRLLGADGGAGTYGDEQEVDRADGRGARDR